MVKDILEMKRQQLEKAGAIVSYDNGQMGRSPKVFPCQHRSGPMLQVLGDCQGCSGKHVGMNCFHPEILKKRRPSHICIPHLRHTKAQNFASEQGYFHCAKCEFREPFTIPKNPRWVVGVTTAPREMATLSQSIKSLHAAGWYDDIHVFAEPGVEDMPAGVTVHAHSTKLGAWRNWLYAARVLSDLDADMALICQDDVLYKPGLRHDLENSWPEGAEIVSPYASAAYSQDLPGYTPHNEGHTYGALCWAMRLAVMKECVEAKMIRSYAKDRGIDGIVPKWMQSTHRPVFIMNPSRAQHIGETSTLYESPRSDKSRKQVHENSPVYLPFRGEFGHKVMWHVPHLYTEHAERVCCIEGEECLYPRAKAFYRIPPLPDSARTDHRMSDGQYLKFLQAKFPVHRLPLSRQPSEVEMSKLERFIPTPTTTVGISPDIVICPRWREVCRERNWGGWHALAGLLRQDFDLFAAGAEESSVHIPGVPSAWEYERDVDVTVEAMLKARLVVATDAGLAHLAVLCGRPLLIICHKKGVYRHRYLCANHMKAKISFVGHEHWNDPAYVAREVHCLVQG